jgi:exodeoxyribonuclease V beta subunit
MSNQHAVTDAGRITKAKTLDPLNFKLHQHALIEASAGTGKTFTIAFLYVRLVLGHGQPQGSLLAEGLLPRDILVVTFTEAATKELIERIRANLSLAAEVFSPEPRIRQHQDITLLSQLKNSYPQSEHAPCRKKLLDALELMDDAAISTIHAWCNRMLSEHAFDSGSLFELSLESDKKPIIQMACEDYWRRHIYPLSLSQLDLLHKIVKSPNDLQQKISASLSSAGCFQAPAALFELSTEIENVQRYLQAQNFEVLIQEAHAAVQTLAANKLNPIKKALEDLSEWSAKSGASAYPSKISSLKGYEYLSKAGFTALIEGQHTIGLCDVIDKLVYLKAITKKDTIKSRRVEMLTHASVHIAQQVAKEQDLVAQLGFDELLVKLNQALASGDSGGDKADDNANENGENINRALAQTIVKQFPVALIDEFQDTDPVQFGIFEKVYFQASQGPQTSQTNEPNANQDTTTASLIMIGDPKQAIYSFRGGDIYTYLYASSKVEQQKYTLATNYRSTENMVNAVNHLFSRAENLPTKAFQFIKEKLGETDAQSLIPFNSVEANGLKDKLVLTNLGQEGLNFWQSSARIQADASSSSEEKEADSDADNKQQSAAQHRAVLAAGCAEQIAQILDASQKQRAYFEHSKSAEKRPILPSDIAILVNKKAEADEIKSALLAKNLNSVYLSTRGSVLSAPEAKDILLWLKACAEPMHVASLRNALATYTLGRSLQDIHKAISDESYLDELITQFQGYHSLWQHQGVLPMIRRLMLDYGVQSQLLEQLNGERVITDILHIGELLQQASAKIDGMTNLVSYYEALLSDENKEENEFMMPRLESDEDLIKVVTVHKSKGLQYPLVFLPFATQKADIMRGTQFLSIHDEHGETQVSFDVDKVKAQKLIELKKEEIRKLYVALTRAKYATWVGAADVKDWHESGLAYILGVTDKDANIGNALAQLAKDNTHCIDISDLPESSDICYTPPPQATLGPAKQAQVSIKQSWRAYSYSSIDYMSHGVLQASTPQTQSENNIDEKVFAQLSENQDDTNSSPDSRVQSLAQSHTETESASSEKAVIENTIHSFYRGAKPGTFLHDILEWAGKTGFAQVFAEPELLNEHVKAQCERAGWAEYADVIFHWLYDVVARPFPLAHAMQGNDGIGAALADLSLAIPEMEFWFSTEHARLADIDQAVISATFEGAPRPHAKPENMSGIFKGYIDLTFEYDGKYYVLDYKSNYLGETDDAYTSENIEAAILHHRYDLQFVIYLVALHRLLKHRILDYDYDTHVGGCVYYFLRGLNSETQGVFTTKPPRVLIEQVDALFKGQALSTNEVATRAITTQAIGESEHPEGEVR